jgi:hypothetical protein
MGAAIAPRLQPATDRLVELVADYQNWRIIKMDQQQDYQQRYAECEWALRECLKAKVPAQAIAVLAYECGFNSTDIKQLTSEVEGFTLALRIPRGVI